MDTNKENNGKGIHYLYTNSDYRPSLIDAVIHAHTVASRLAAEHFDEGKDCARCAIEHYQLYLWLKELGEVRLKLNGDCELSVYDNRFYTFAREHLQ